MRLVSPWSIVVLATLAASAAAAPAVRLPPDPSVVFAPTAATPEKDSSKQGARFAIATNLPLLWRAGNVGGSAYMALDAHWAMRANVARYDALALLPLQLLLNDDGPSRNGDLLDVGLGGVWYSRRPWDGFTLELGALVRDRDFQIQRDSLTDAPDADVRTTTLAARGMLGWSWMLGTTLCVSAAAGISAGLEHGRETEIPESGMSTTHQVDRLQIDFETYLRVGFVFGR